MASSLQPLELGSRVTIRNVGDAPGTVRFLGDTGFSAGDWVGVELDEAKGKNDGSVKGVRYFECEAQHGIFVRPKDCTLVARPASLVAQAPEHSSQAGDGPVVHVNNHTAHIAEDQKQDNEEEDEQEEQSEGSAAPETLRLYELRMRKLRAEVQLQLASAMEDHDVSQVRQILPLATSCGVALSELEAAHRLLEYEQIMPIATAVEEVHSAVMALTREHAGRTQLGANGQRSGMPPPGLKRSPLPAGWIELAVAWSRRCGKACSLAWTVLSSLLLTSSGSRLLMRSRKSGRSWQSDHRPWLGIFEPNVAS